MEQRSEENEQAAITAIKRNILIHWALQPPKLNTLRPIDQLVVSIHTVFPPAFGVPGHEYFQKWKPILPGELTLSAAMGNTPNEEKLKKGKCRGLGCMPMWDHCSPVSVLMSVFYPSITSFTIFSCKENSILPPSR